MYELSYWSFAKNWLGFAWQMFMMYLEDFIFWNFQKQTEKNISW